MAEGFQLFLGSCFFLYGLKFLRRSAMMQDEKFYKSVGRWGVLHFGRKYAIHERRPVGSSPPLFLRKNQFLAALVSSKRSNRCYNGVW